MPFKLMFLSLVFLLASGCGEDSYPIDIAEKFWRAVKTKDAETIRKYSSSDSLKTEKPGQDILPLDEITLGKTVIDGDAAWVDTTVTISGDKPFTIPLRTVLLRENKQWKVDYGSTIKVVSEGSSVSHVINNIKNLSKDLATEFNQSMEELQEKIPEMKDEVEQLEESLIEKIPELKKQIEEFVSDLKEAIKEFGKDTEESTVTEI